MSRIDDLRSVTTRIGLAYLLGVKPKTLGYIVYKKHPGLKYFPFQIPKRAGGVRTIHAPAADLKLLQSKLSVLLQDCVDDINAERSMTESISHGFRRSRSIITNARCHRRRKWVFNIDLEGFFDAINFGRVRGFFLSNKNFQLHDEVATTIAQIACHNNALPQGSPSSPIISNLIAHVMDIRLAKLAEQHGCHYTRYADDLTFSTSKTNFPAPIARPVESEGHMWEPGDDLTAILQKSGFSVNAAKTRMQYRSSRQEVTGLVVNATVNTRRRYDKVTRAMVHRLRTTGGFFVKEQSADLFGNIVESEVPGSLNQLQGRLSFINQVKKSNWTRENPGPKTIAAYEKSYRTFLFFKTFYANSAPLIVCEGKTDNVYLRCAIRALGPTKVPKLVKKPDKKLELSVRFFPFTETNRQIMGLSGGVPQLTNLIGMYDNHWRNYAAGHSNFPVIVIVDNDAASKKLFGLLSSLTKKKVDGTEPFIHVLRNLYVVPIPKIGGKDTVIEQLFRKEVLKQKIGGKSFNPAQGIWGRTRIRKAHIC